MPVPQVALVSDDLTGALDAAAPFVAVGKHCVVATEPAALPAALAAGAEVVAVSLNSREATAKEAARRVREAVGTLAGVPLLFKKIDSRMKGHVAQEVRELALARGMRRVVLCPAIPEFGRLVEAGQVIGHGLAEPVPVSAECGEGIIVAVPEARTDADLDRIVAQAGNALFVGARGLAAALARREKAAPGPAAPRLEAPCAFVIGSRDPITGEQVARLRQALPDAGWIAAPDGQAEVVGALPEVVILQAVPGAGADGATVAARLAQSVTGGFLDGRRTVLMTGGETAAACLRAMGVGVLRLVGEVRPGMPISLALDFPGAPHIVTKSGGFGHPDCLANLLRDPCNERTGP